MKRSLSIVIICVLLFTGLFICLDHPAYSALPQMDDAQAKESTQSMGKYMFLALLAVGLFFAMLNATVKWYTKSRFLRTVLLQDVMDSHPNTVNDDMRVSAVGNLMIERSSEHIVIVGMMKEVEGLISKHQIDKIAHPHKDAAGLLRYAPNRVDRYRLTKVMTKNPATLTPYDTLLEALNLLPDNPNGSIPITNESGVLQGIVTKNDILIILKRFKINPQKVPNYKVLMENLSVPKKNAPEETAEADTTS